MLRRTTILICILQTFYSHTVEGLTCLSCDSISQPRHCHFVARCNNNETCGAEMLPTTAGYNSYKLGCVSKNNCHNGSSLHGPLCKQCCNTDLCNAALCGEPDYPPTRGPICYDCPFHTPRQLCRKIQFCAADEECIVKAAEEFGDQFVTSGCQRKHLCPARRSVPSGSLIGKRSLGVVSSASRSLGSVRSASRPMCESCCWQDLCNLNCSTIDQCSDSSCMHGSCVTTNSSSACNCSSGWQGERCNDVDPCSSAPCGIGTCQVNAASYSCTCLNGWTGPTCRVSSVDCDFEADFCSWVQDSTDDFDWSRNSGTTGSSNTGPNRDHTTGSGYYMYIETSSPRVKGDRADLMSPLLAPGNTYCMDLALNMYGNTMGAINVYIKPERKSKIIIQHFKQITSSTSWYVRNITIPAQTHNFNIVIEGVRGTDYYGDAAIDDVHLKPGAC